MPDNGSVPASNAAPASGTVQTPAAADGAAVPAGTVAGAAPTGAAPNAATSGAPANTDAAAVAAAAEAAKAAAADPAKVAADAAAKVVADKAIADAQAAATKKIADDARNEYGSKLVKTVGDMRADWLAKSKADAEYGGVNYDSNLGIAKQAMEAYVSPAFKQFLDETGLGNHPEFIRSFLKVGKDIAESKLIVGRQAAGAAGDKTLAQKLYPNNP